MTEQIEQIQGEADLVMPFGGKVRCVLASDDADTVAQKLAWLEALREWAKQACQQIEKSAEEWIKDNKPVQVGELLYWVGPVKKPPKCVHIPTAIEKLLDACGGDFERFCTHLSSGAIKYGAARATLPQDVYESLFVVEEVEELQSDEAAKAMRKLQKAPVHFLKGR